MKIVHAVIRKLRPRACQPDGVRGNILRNVITLVSPPRLAMDEPILMIRPSQGCPVVVPYSLLSIRNDGSESVKSAGWAYLHWKHFFAHLLVIGRPKISDAAISLSFRRKIFVQICSLYCLLARLHGLDCSRAISSIASWLNYQAILNRTGCNCRKPRIVRRIFRSFQFRACKSPFGSNQSRLNDIDGRGESTVQIGSAA